MISILIRLAVKTVTVNSRQMSLQNLLLMVQNADCLATMAMSLFSK